MLVVLFLKGPLGAHDLVYLLVRHIGNTCFLLASYARHQGVPNTFGRLGSIKAISLSGREIHKENARLVIVKFRPKDGKHAQRSDRHVINRVSEQKETHEISRVAQRTTSDIGIFRVRQAGQQVEVKTIPDPVKEQQVAQTGPSEAKGIRRREVRKGMNFRKFLEHNPLKIQNSFSQNTVGTHNDRATASFLPSTWTGSENLGPFGYGLPGIDLSIPSVEKTSVIRSIEKNKNPITIMLMDGTKLYLSLDEFNRIKSFKNLEKGEKITVSFQRNPGDERQEPSKIIAIN